MTALTLTIPIRTISEANQREHWAKKAARVKDQRGTALLMARMPLRPFRSTPHLLITLTRIAPRPLDTDNAVRSLKAIRDGIADALGIDDGNVARVTWAYRQRKAAEPKHYAVDVRVEARAAV